MKIWRLIALLTALCLVLSFAGCRLFGGDDEEGSASSGQEDSEEEEYDPEYPVKAGGIELLARPGRVVSLAPALTEKLYDLGLDDRLVGVSDYCDYPSGVLALSPCGSAQIPDMDVIEALSPHLIVTEAPLPEDAMDRLDELEIPVAVLPHADSVDELYYTYTDLARLMEGENAGMMIGDSVADEFKRRLNYLDSILSGYAEENGRKKVLYLRLLDFTVATGDTFENDLMDHIGLDNIAADYENWDYPADEAATAEGLAAFESVDIIFMDEDFVTITSLEQSEFYKGLPATIGDHYLYISSVVMERQSMRCLDLLARMAAYAYPDAQPVGGFDFGDGPIGGGDAVASPGDEADGGDEPAQSGEGDDMLAALDDMP